MFRHSGEILPQLPFQLRTAEISCKRKREYMTSFTQIIHIKNGKTVWRIQHHLNSSLVLSGAFCFFGGFPCLWKIEGMMENLATRTEGIFWASVAVPCFRTKKKPCSKDIKTKFKPGARTKMQEGGATVHAPRKHPYALLLTDKCLRIGLNRWTWAYVLSRNEDRVAQK